jgi:hypothetical protein
VLSCSNSTGPDNKPPADPVIIDQVSADVTDTGATLTLQNGMALAVPPGAVEGTVKVDLLQVEDTLYNADIQTVLKISADGSIAQASFRLPLAAGQDTTICGAALLTNNGQTMTRLTGTVNATEDTLVVEIGEGAVLQKNGSAADPVAAGEYVIEMGAPLQTTSLRNVLRLPYYQQDGGNCWAACSIALMKAYQNNFAFDEIYEMCQVMNIEKEAGVVWHDTDILGDKIKLAIGLEPEIHSWVFYENFKNFIVKQVDQGLPVMVNMLTHQGNFIGYEIENPGPNQEFYFIYHDPQAFYQDPPNPSDQIPYRKISLNALQNQYWNGTANFMLYNYFTTLNLKVPTTNPTMQTVHLPDADIVSGATYGFQEGLEFDKNGLIVEWVIWDYTKPSGLLFRDFGGTIPRDFTTIVLRKVPVWNMEETAAVPVRIKTSLYRKDGNVFKEPPVLVKDETTSVAAKSKYNYKADLAVADFIDKLHSPDSMLALETEIFSTTGTRLDAFDVSFKYRPLWIRTLSPSSGQIGDWVTVSGVGFGPTMTSVTFDNAPAVSVSVWNDSTIVAKVPDGAAAGDVVVTVGSYKSNAKYFGMTGLLDQVKRCKFEQFNAFGVFNTIYSRMFGLFWPAKSNERELEWNGRVATKSYTAAIDDENQYFETVDLRIVFAANGAKIDSINGYCKVERILEGKTVERTITELGGTDLDFQYSMDDEDGFFCWYVLEKEEIAPKLTKLRWVRNSFNADGSVFSTDLLLSVDWLNNDHDGELKLLLWEILP